MSGHARWLAAPVITAIALTGVAQMPAAASPIADMTFNAAGDATVLEANPTSARGTADPTNCFVNENTGDHQQCLLTFTVSGLTAGDTVTAAKLLIVDKGNATGTKLVNISTIASFNEATVTWTNKPSLGTTVGSQSSHAFGVDSAFALNSGTVTGNGTYSFALWSPDNSYSTGMNFHTKENTAGKLPPRLVLSVDRANVAPVAALDVTPGTVKVDATVTADASGSTDANGNIASYRFDWGDGTTTGPQASPTATHSYNWSSSTKSRTVTVTVTDSGGLSDTETDSVTVTNQLRLGHWRNRPADTGTWRQRMDATEAQYGAFEGHWRFFLNSQSNGQLGSDHEQALTGGKRIFGNWKVAGTGSWANTAAGNRDSVIVAAARDWNSACGSDTDRCWVTFEHEPENGTGGSGSGMTAADYVAMWEHVADIWEQYAPNVTRVWVMIGNPNTANLAAYWPGADDVDLLGHDPYIACSGTASQLATNVIDRSNWMRANLTGASTMSVVVAEYGPDLGGNQNPCGVSGGDRGTDQHRADSLNGLRTRMNDILDARIIEMDYFDAGSDWLSNSGVDATAYQSWKTATES